MKFEPKMLRLYAVTDRKWLNGRTLMYDVERALDGGATMVQLREKNIETDKLLDIAVKMKALCEKYGAPLIINDNVEVAKISGADGVHLGQNDMNAHDARQLLGNNKIIGVTAKSVRQARDAEMSGADYLGSGAVFGTYTKPDAKRIEPKDLKEIASSVSIPIVAIGGITAENVELLKNTNIAGCAVVSGIFAQEDIRKAARTLYERIGEII